MPGNGTVTIWQDLQQNLLNRITQQHLIVVRNQITHLHVVHSCICSSHRRYFINPFDASCSKLLLF